MKKLFKLSFVGVAICSAISFAQAKPNPQLTDYIMGSINGANSGQRISGQEQTNRGKEALKNSQLSKDEDSACGAILCLAGGGNGGSSCSGAYRPARDRPLPPSRRDRWRQHPCGPGHEPGSARKRR